MGGLSYGVQMLSPESDNAAHTPIAFDYLPDNAAEDFLSVFLCARTGDYFAKVNHEAASVLWPFTWSLHRCGKGRIYARAQRCPHSGRAIRLYMHHLIADAFGIKKPTSAHTHLDHKNGDGLDNQEHNLVWRLPVVNRWGTARWGDR